MGWPDLVINVSQTRSKDWIPACAESTPHLEQKGSGGMTDRVRFVRGPLSALLASSVGCQDGHEEDEFSFDDGRQDECDESHVDGTPPITSVGDEDEDGEQYSLSDEEHLDEPQRITPWQCARIAHPYEEGIQSYAKNPIHDRDEEGLAKGPLFAAAPQ